jgi:hypothetical protein
MAKRKRELTDTELRYHSNRKFIEDVLGTSFTNDLERCFHFEEFFMVIRVDFIDEALPGLQTLQLLQYPLIAAFNEPKALACIRETHELNASGLIWSCWRMIENMKKA